MKYRFWLSTILILIVHMGVVVVCLWNYGYDGYLWSHPEDLPLGFTGTSATLAISNTTAYIRGAEIEKQILFVFRIHRVEALDVLTRYILQHGQNTKSTNTTSGSTVTEDLLNANVLPHLTKPSLKIQYLAHMIGSMRSFKTWKNGNVSITESGHNASMWSRVYLVTTMCAQHWHQLDTPPTSSTEKVNRDTFLYFFCAGGYYWTGMHDTGSVQLPLHGCRAPQFSVWQLWDKRSDIEDWWSLSVIWVKRRIKFLV